MENKNFILFIAIAAVILLLWTEFVSGPQLEEQRATQEAEEQISQAGGLDDIPNVQGSTGGTGEAANLDSADTMPDRALSREAALAQSSRLAFEGPSVRGSISLVGGRIDDLVLNKFQETTDPSSPSVKLLTPSGVKGTYFADFGWAPEAGQAIKVPDKDSVWQQSGSGNLSPERSVEIFWDNGEGLTFRRTISMDENYMFTIVQSVENNTQAPVHLYPYNRLTRYGMPDISGFFILHEGFLGVYNDELVLKKYKKIREDGAFATSSTGGWTGITDKYWLTALIPDQTQSTNSSFSNKTIRDTDRIRAQNVSATATTIVPGGRSEVKTHLFAGAKENKLLTAYRDEMGIPIFDLAIDWGFFRFFTKPLFQVVHFFGDLTGNFGIAILITTVLVKLLFFPLANKQYQSMSMMKKVQPEMAALRERFSDDKAKQQQELMALYKREKINPAAGCLPIIVQIPVFFALYKVLFVTIEMRQAPFFGWIQDLAAPDPTTVFNLFGLLPWDPSGVPFIGTTLALGIWPLIMGVTMFLQMRMNPAPQDPMQQKMFTFMPIIFTILLASFPAGLVIYWAWNNSLSIAQQYVIMRRSGVEVELAKNLKLDFLLEKFGKKPATAQLEDKSEDSDKT